MGPLRRGVILALLPGPALAEVCDKLNPGWDGVPVSAIVQTGSLFVTPISLVLLLVTALVLRFKNQWGALGVVVLWTIWVSILSMYDPGGTQELARREGCVGSPSLFIALVAAICVATILYTNPRPERD